MGVFIGAVVLHTPDPGGASEFWRGALGYDAATSNADFLHPPEWHPPSGSRAEHGAPHVHLDGGDATHLDLWVDADSDLETEVARLIALGARRVEWTYAEGADHVVLEAPDGTLLCVIP
ncbi:conserved hypothetical protein [Beutenbergia cavernae DSM 12333]|uniref:Glyoxalase-like domain-containing protein n=1 Tax=Beutenbergia cavernae (strain ATCC BAA-8 / DSM 12333 / CCUG 43141 / JCM 11478 / NBRC 16432 / NCIMB 13614 / HKI 0122) TaxID=471853 RepID=C5BZ47_BEUC1|nr:VOC family protein [Beutenbergia cavernae]ACQ81162.1 conserved hypothetical protein [Beutenbergia cavernae DSM 12333]